MTTAIRNPSPTTIIIRPNPGPQEQFLASPADIAIFGGSAGCGKTYALLLESLRHMQSPTFNATIFRRIFPEIVNPGGLWSESERLYSNFHGEPKLTTMEWSFPSGATIKFGHLQHEDDKLNWKGAQIPLLGFDQLETFTEGQFWYLFSRNRDPSGAVRSYTRATCNPVPEDDRIGGWLHTLLSWWIGEDGLPIWERSGQLRWLARDGDVICWGESREALRARFPKSEPNSLTFIPGRLEHNPPMARADPGYRSRLMLLPLVERERLLGGNWKIRPTAGKIFNRAWFEIVPAAPAVARRVRYWDKAGTEDGGDYSAGVRLAEVGGLYYVEEAIRGQWSSAQRNAVIRQTAFLDGLEVAIWLEQEPGSGGKESAEISVRQLAGFPVRAEPVTGDKITRANPLAAQAEAGNVKLIAGPWVKDFLDELHSFPESKYDDQVDAASGAFNKLSLGIGRDLEIRAMGERVREESRVSVVRG